MWRTDAERQEKQRTLQKAGKIKLHRKVKQPQTKTVHEKPARSGLTGADISPYSHMAALRELSGVVLEQLAN